MKRFLTFAFCLMAATLFAANPAFTDFNSNQFGTSGNKVVIKSGTLLTNPVVNSGVITGNGAGLTNLNIPASSVTNLGTAAYSNSASFQNASAILSNVVSGASNAYVGSFTGNGSGLTNLAQASLPAGVTTNNGTLTSLGFIEGDGGRGVANTAKTVITNNHSAAVTFASTVTGNGSGLTNLNNPFTVIGSFGNYSVNTTLRYTTLVGINNSSTEAAVSLPISSGNLLASNMWVKFSASASAGTNVWVGLVTNGTLSPFTWNAGQVSANAIVSNTTLGTFIPAHTPVSLMITGNNASTLAENIVWGVQMFNK